MLTDASDNDSYIPTEFDKSRLDDMEIGETIKSESGDWKVLRYKDEYVLIIKDRRNNIFKDGFRSISDVCVFLNNL